MRESPGRLCPVRSPATAFSPSRSSSSSLADQLWPLLSLDYRQTVAIAGVVPPLSEEKENAHTNETLSALAVAGGGWW